MSIDLKELAENGEGIERVFDNKKILVACALGEDRSIKIRIRL